MTPFATITAMSLSKKQLAGIEAARKRRKTTEVPFKVDDELEVTLEFASAMTIDSLDIIDSVVGGDVGDQATMAARGRAVRDFLMELATDETIEMLNALEAAKLVGLNEYATIQNDLVEVIAARPTTRSTSSEDG